MLVAAVYLTFDPAWPWSWSGGGLPLFGAVMVALAALTIWTYRGAPNVSGRRLLVILSLRLAALLVACAVILRPSLAREDEESALPSKLILVIDSSESANITDEFNNLSRWEAARRLLQTPTVRAALAKLSAQKVELIQYQAAEDLAPFNPNGQAEGKRTDIGQWLQTLLKNHAGEQNLQAALLFSDGADNGTIYPALEKAAAWRGLCPLHVFALGRPTTTLKQRDIAFVKIHAEPVPVPVKGKLTVKGEVNAPGFENSRVNLSLYIDGVQVGPVKEEILARTEGNQVQITGDAPIKPGEIKVTLRIQPLPGEVTPLNNEISTYVTVTNEGISVLWVEGKRRAYEPVFVLRHALSRDPRFRVFFTERLRQAAPTDDQDDFFDFDKQHYDAIVIGDISAQRFAGKRLEVFGKIKQLVEDRGVGLLMLGGYETFANSDWHKLPQAAELVNLLPVALTMPGQLEGPARLIPTKAGLQYLLRVGTSDQETGDFWERKLEPLDGMTVLGKVKPTATVLATRDGVETEPLMVGTQAGKGRTLAFGGDTTWKSWRRSPEMLPAYERFWKQTLIWLAQQENLDDNIWVKPDTRRLAAGRNQRLGFTVGLRGKGGLDLPNARFQVKVIGPNKEEIAVATAREGTEERGYFWKTGLPGEYEIVATGEGKDRDGHEVKPAQPARARFLCFAEDVENLRPAADHDFLARLASAGGGRFHQAEERKLSLFLEELAGQTKMQNKPRVDLFPDWRRNPISDTVSDQLATLWSTALLPSFFLFVIFLAAEWFCRRHWGLV